MGGCPSNCCNKDDGSLLGACGGCVCCYLGTIEQIINYITCTCCLAPICEDDHPRQTQQRGVVHFIGDHYGPLTPGWYDAETREFLSETWQEGQAWCNVGNQT